jgi:MYXO-CTERM domain-containing protein
VRSIQPIVLTFRAPEPCVPLRLTAIAANPDMPVLVWVFAEKRVVPRGFFELTIDELRIDWQRNGSNYFGPKGLLSQAANEAGGNAFIAEYAGPSNIARGAVYTNGQFNLTALRAAMTPPAYVQQMISMGLGNDTLTLPLLAKYIPMPEAVKQMGITESMFYGNLATYWAQYAFPPYDLPGLTAAIETSIIEPRMKAQMMIDQQPYLTRLNTFISPEEMNKDPFFFENQDLGNVPLVRTAVINTMCGAQEYMACNAPMRLELPDGRMAWLKPGSKATTCQFVPNDVVGLQSLPAAEVAYERETVGEGRRVVDNTSVIRAGLAAHNAKFAAEQMAFPIPGAAGSPGAGAGGAGGMSSTPGSGGRAGTGVAGNMGIAGSAGTTFAGTAGTTGSPDGGGPGVSQSGGCACSAAADPRSELAAVAAACALGLALFRRRRATRDAA